MRQKKNQICTQMYDRETGALFSADVPTVKIRVFIRRESSPTNAEIWGRRENRNAADLSPSIPDDQGFLRFKVFISRPNLGQSGNTKISDRLGFSRHMKISL